MGNSRYDNLPDLPKVEQDIKNFMSLLLGRCGVDTVYVAYDSVASPELIRRYMLEFFPKSLGRADRLIFYYSGHADDFRGTTGYMQFKKARSGEFWKEVLPITDTYEWSKVIDAKHILFLYDACSSGLAFESKGAGDSYEKLLASLSGEGSRIVITAGTGGQKTADGWFTAALIRGLTSNHSDHFITAHEVYSVIQKTVAESAASHQMSITPKLWELDNYSGTFIFINPNHIELPLHGEYMTYISQKGSGPDFFSTFELADIVMLLSKEAGKLIIAVDSFQSSTGIPRWLTESLQYRLEGMLYKQNAFIPVRLDRLIQSLSSTPNIPYDKQQIVDRVMRAADKLNTNILIISGNVDEYKTTSVTNTNPMGGTTTKWRTRLSLSINTIYNDTSNTLKRVLKKELSASNKAEAINSTLEDMVSDIENLLMDYHPAGKTTVQNKTLSAVWLDAGFREGMRRGDYYYILRPKTLEPLSLVVIDLVQRGNSRARTLYGHRQIQGGYSASRIAAPELKKWQISLQVLNLPSVIDANPDHSPKVTYSDPYQINISAGIIALDYPAMPYFSLSYGKIYMDSNPKNLLSGMVIEGGFGIRQQLVPGFINAEGNVNIGFISLNQKLTDYSRALIIDREIIPDSDVVGSTCFSFCASADTRFILDKGNLVEFYIGLGIINSGSANTWSVTIKSDDNQGESGFGGRSSPSEEVDSSLLPLKSVRFDGLIAIGGITIRIP